MKKMFFVVAVALLSCTEKEDSGCAKTRSEYYEKKKEAAALLSVIQKADLEDRMQLEDEYVIMQVEITMLEIAMDDADCSYSK